MTDASVVNDGAAPSGDEATDSAGDAWEWRIRWQMEDVKWDRRRYRYDLYQTETAARRRFRRRASWPGYNQYDGDWARRKAFRANLQRRRVGPWEDVD